jgi:glycosyltransferase involved in cell wall biosynthesis
MKIAFILPSLSNHGPNVFTLNLINGLLALGIRPEVFYFTENIELKFPVECHKIEITNYKIMEGFDIVHSTMLKPDLFSAVWQRNVGPKFVTGIHNFYDEDLNFLYSSAKAKFASFLWRWSFRRIKNAIVSSEQMKSYYINSIGQDLNFKIIPYGVNIPNISNQSTLKFRAEVELLKNKGFKIVGSCGLLIKRKGYDTLLRAAALSNNLAVVLVGDGPERAPLSDLAIELKISDRVIFLGQQPDSSRFYAFFDIFAMTSLSEGFGIAMLEALALGLPLVCSNLDIYKNYFTKEQVSLFTPGDITDLNREIIRTLSDTSYFSRKSFELYTNNFTLELMARRHFDFYNDILNRI